MKMIVAVDSNWAIGYEGKLLARNKEDMKFFKETTINNIVIMGRKTLESFPGGNPLKDRDNIVITRDDSYIKDGVYIAHSVKEAVDIAEDINKDNREVYVIGGASIYEQMLDLCDEIFVTKMDYEYTADTYFPNLDEDSRFTVSYTSEDKEYPDGKFRFITYSKK